MQKFADFRTSVQHKFGHARDVNRWEAYGTDTDQTAAFRVLAGGEGGVTEETTRLGIASRVSEYNIKMNLKDLECEAVYWMYQAY
jgi:hypothetical protein